MNDDEWPESAGQSGPSKDDGREDIDRSEESDGERNGEWSDLTADFVLFETDAEDGFLRRFEEICY